MLLRQPHRLGRRLFSLTTGITLFLAQSVAARSLPNGVAAGDVDQTSAVLWARSDSKGMLVLEYATDPTFQTIDGGWTAEVLDPLVPAKRAIDGLSPGTTYYYRAIDAVGDESSGRFRTPAESGFHGLRFGVSGDWRGELSPYPAISNVSQRDLDFFVALGDTIYADIPSPDVPVNQARTLAEFRLKHNEVYKRRFGAGFWIEARASTSLLATIDDHEVTNDFAGGAAPATDSRFENKGAFINETPLFENGLRVFHEYNPIRESFYGDTGDPRTAGKRRLYRFRTYGHDAAVFLLDARSFRDEELSLSDFANTVQFQGAAFDPTRTMLGRAQLQDLKADLLSCRRQGITWKFILVPEPIQNLGPILAGDRFEGYAFERSALLAFLEDNAIDNVVFVSADIHATIVNNLVYAEGPFGPQRETSSFEVTTGSVAFDAPFGPTVAFFFEPLREAFVQADPRRQNVLVAQAANSLFGFLGVPAIGLSGTPIDAMLLEGAYLSTNTYGWTEFEISVDTQCLTVTTYGIPWYTEEALLADPEEIISRSPRVVGRFRVQPRLSGTGSDVLPRCNPPRGLCGAFGLFTPMFLSLAMTGWVTYRRHPRFDAARPS